jgi:ubiquinol-cytochrome c reductase cytochrome b subunit/cytochrome b6
MSENQNPEEKTVPFFPDHLMYEAKVAMWFGIGLIVVGIIGMFSPVGLGEPADPMVTPEHTTPEWYFLWLFQLLKYFPSTVPGTEIEGRVLGAVVPILLVGILILWPFLDSKTDETRKPTYYRTALSGIVLVIIIVLSILGEVS